MELSDLDSFLTMMVFSLWPWVNHWASLSFHSFTCKMGIVIAASQDCQETVCVKVPGKQGGDRHTFTLKQQQDFKNQTRRALGIAFGCLGRIRGKMRRMGGKAAQDWVNRSKQTFGLVSDLYGHAGHFVLEQEVGATEAFCIHSHVNFPSLIHLSTLYTAQLPVPQP